MSYHYETRRRTLRGPKTLGTRLGRLAINKGLSVQELSNILGASRMSIYNWIVGGAISPAYRKPVEDLIKTLQAK